MRHVDLCAGIGGFSLAARGLGNAVVPQIPFVIFSCIQAAMEEEQA